MMPFISWPLARHNVDKRSSARPSECFAMKSALAGATKIKSASLDNSMWGIPFEIRSSHWLTNTGKPLTACSVVGVTNCVAALVMTTCTVAPSLINALTSSGVL